jgi:uncharacterized protein
MLKYYREAFSYLLDAILREEKKLKKSKKLFFAVALIAFFIIFGFFSEILNFITDYQWFKELGYEEVFLKKIYTQFTLGIPVFFIASSIYYLYLFIL